jgi:hypothetical protein
MKHDNAVEATLQAWQQQVDRFDSAGANAAVVMPARPGPSRFRACR